MVVNTIALERNLNIIFNKTYAEAIAGQGGDNTEQLFTRVTSTSKDQKYGWLGDVPAIKEWIGDKDTSGLKDAEYTIVNKHWYVSVAIDENEIKDDQTNMIRPRVETMATDMANFPMDLVAELIRDGDTNLAYDGQAFFANRTVNDNLLAGTGITLAQLKTDMATGRVAMQRFVSDTGKLFKLKPNVIVCPPELEVSFMELIKSTSPQDASNYNSAGRNPWSTWITSVISIPELTDTNDWYMFHTLKALKPFIYQDRESPSTQIDQTSRNRNRKIVYSAECRGNGGYGFPMMGIKIVNS